MAEKYPKRTAYFAIKYIRLMAKETLANELGPDVFCLLSVVVATEDASGYRRAVGFYNAQLMPLCGIANEDRLARARAKAVAAGWLHYKPGRRGVAPKYWVLVPAHATGLDDHPTDEQPHEYGGGESLDAESQDANRPQKQGVRTRAIRGQNAGNPRSERGQSAEPPFLDLDLDLDLKKKTPPPPAKPGGVCAADDFVAETGETNHDPAARDFAEQAVELANGVFAPPPFADFVAAWVAAKLPGWDAPGGIRDTGTRRGLWIQRLSNDWWAANWRAGVEMLGQSPRARGLEPDFQRGVRLDTLLEKPDYLAQVLEGAWPAGGTAPKPAAPPRKAGLLTPEEMAAELRRRDAAKGNPHG